MASNNRTPQSVLDAPEKNVVVVEPHPGYNRAMLRAAGHKGGGAKPQARMADRKKSVNPLKAEIRAAQSNETFDTNQD